MGNAIECVLRAASDVARTLVIVAVVSLVFFLLVEGALALVALFAPECAEIISDFTAFWDPLRYLSQVWTYLAQALGGLLDLVLQAWSTLTSHFDAQGSACAKCCAQCCADCCTKCSPEGRDMNLGELLAKLAPLWTSFQDQLFQTLLAIALPSSALFGAWLLDRVNEYTSRVGCYAIQIVAWVVFFYAAHAIGAALSPMLAVLTVPLQMILPMLLIAGEAFGEMHWLFQVLLALFAGIAVVVGAVVGLWLLGGALLREIGHIQETLHSLLVGSVHPAFPRQSEGRAEHLASDRRKNIKAFLDTGKLPNLRTEYRLTPGDQRKFREHIVRREIEEEGPPRLVNQFLEFPDGSSMVLKQPCLPEGPEEAVGQYVRLNFEMQKPAKRNWWLRLWGNERHEEIIVPLLARVVDAAILADQHADTLRRETDWNGMPFYERIYAEYTPLPFPLGCLLRPVIGPGMPARVVIETHYPEVFFNALPGGTNWFGIGVQIEEPNLPQDSWSRLRRHWGCKMSPMRRERLVWKGAVLEPLCRRLKSHVLSVLSGRIDVTFVGAPRDGIERTQQSRKDSYYIMPSGPLADGCPSVVRPASYPAPTATASPTTQNPPLKADSQRVKIPLPPRGTVSNAPPAWLFPASGGLFSDCHGNCLKGQSASPTQAMEIMQSDIGTITLPSSLLPRRFRGPDRRWLYRRVWSGAFFDTGLRLANRFPLFGCSYSRGEMSFRTKTRMDLRGGLAETMFVGWPFRRLRALAEQGYREWTKLGGVFLSTQGPEHAGNLLLPEPLLLDYLNHLAQHDTVLRATKECKGPAFVPKSQETTSR